MEKINESSIINFDNSFVEKKKILQKVCNLKFLSKYQKGRIISRINTMFRSDSEFINYPKISEIINNFDFVTKNKKSIINSKIKMLYWDIKEEFHLLMDC